MNRLMLCVAALSLWGCAPTDSDSAIRVTSAKVVAASEGGCVFSDSDVAITSGSLDISVRNRYLIQFDVVSTLVPVETQVGGDVLAGQHRNDFIADQIVLNYSAPNLTFEEETLAIYAVFAPGSTNPTIVDLLAPKALTTLQSALATAGSSTQLSIRFQLSGHVASGATMRSTEATFPVFVYNSGFSACPAGQAVTTSGPCGSGGGQDGLPICCPADATGKVTCPGA